MGKTSIDGLAVRSPKGRTNTRAAQKTTKKTPTSPRRTQQTRKAVAEHTDPLLQKNEKQQTVAKRNFVDNSSFVENNDADWSELLKSIEDEKENESHDEPETKSKVAPQMAYYNTRRSGHMENLYDDDDGIYGFEDELLAEEHPKIKKQRKKTKARHIGRKIVFAVLLILLIGIGALYFWGDSLISRLTGGQSGIFGTLSAMISKEVPFEKDENGRTNVLVFGTEGYNMAGETADGTHDGAQLTDSIMVISFDQETKDVALLSLPRDLKVTMACSVGKINEVFWCHNQSGTDEQAGATALMDQVGQILGINFQYYAHVNWSSLIDIVNTLGGISITLDEDINDYNYTGAVGKAGDILNLDGEQALGFARARHGTQGGDFTRGNTQQKIVSGIVEKMLNTNLDVGTILNLLNILGDNLRTNFSADNIKAGIRLAIGFSLDNIRQVPLVDYDSNTYYVKSATINDVSYVIPSAGVGEYDEIQNYIRNMFSSDALMREDAKVLVLNATGGFGVASAERDALTLEGFTVKDVGDAPEGSCDKATCVLVLNETVPKTAQQLAERYGIVYEQTNTLPDGVMVTDDIDIVVILARVDEE